MAEEGGCQSGVKSGSERKVYAWAIPHCAQIRAKDLRARAKDGRTTRSSLGIADTRKEKGSHIREGKRKVTVPMLWVARENR